MTRIANIPSASIDLTGTASTGVAPGMAPAMVQQSAREIEKAADYRLVIEEDPATGSFVYKTLDRRTGEVVSQFPRDQMLRMKDSYSYTPGKVFDGQT
jgi:flagellar protein FlaG